jgi:hypothetical protein
VESEARIGKTQYAVHQVLKARLLGRAFSPDMSTGFVFAFQKEIGEARGIPVTLERRFAWQRTETESR